MSDMQASVNVQKCWRWTHEAPCRLFDCDVRGNHCHCDAALDEIAKRLSLTLDTAVQCEYCSAEVYDLRSMSCAVVSPGDDRFQICAACTQEFKAGRGLAEPAEVVTLLLRFESARHGTVEDLFTLFGKHFGLMVAREFINR